MRNCNDCTLCCTWLKGEAYGHTFGNGKSCSFKCNTGCSIYNKRPDTCKNYKCAWLQEIIPLELKPDSCGIIVSVELWNDNNYLRAIETQQQVISNLVLKQLLNFCIENNCYLAYQYKTKWHYFGSNEFIAFCNSKLEQV